MIVLRDVRAPNLALGRAMTAVGVLLASKKYEISIQIPISNRWNAGGRELVRRSFRVTEPFKPSGEYKGQQLKRALTLLLSKTDSAPPFQSGKLRTSRYNLSGMVEELREAESEVEAAKSRLEENMGTELASLYWDSWERKRLHAQELKMFKDHCDVILRDWLPQTQKRYADYARSLGMKPNSTLVGTGASESECQKALEDREEYAGNIANDSTQNRRKRTRVDMADESPALQIDGAIAGVVEDAELWKWN